MAEPFKSGGKRWVPGTSPIKDTDEEEGASTGAGKVKTGKADKTAVREQKRAARKAQRAKAKATIK